MFYLRHSSDCKHIHQYKFLCTVPQNILIVFYFPITTVLCRIADIYETQACAVTLNPAPVVYLGKLPFDAAIHALIFRQVNLILDLIQAQVTLSTHTKSSSSFLSRKLPVDAAIHALIFRQVNR